MAIVPDKAQEKLIFYQSKITPWTTNATAIGLVAGDVTSLNTLCTTAQAALAAKVAAAEAAKAATQNWKDAVVALAVDGSDLIKKIKAKAAVTGNSVYTLAQLPVPAIPAPVGPPGMPSDLIVVLNPSGALSLKWKCANPVGGQGVTYQVSRKVGSATSYTFIGSTGQRKFTDESLPVGSSSVVYQIQAFRSTTSGTANYFLVNFGVGGSGEMFASVVAPKLAA